MDNARVVGTGSVSTAMPYRVVGVSAWQLAVHWAAKKQLWTAICFVLLDYCCIYKQQYDAHNDQFRVGYQYVVFRCDCNAGTARA